jgi:GT2 family glycosyltransferase
MQIIVLGMHRSGTSALARLLNMMGCYFGEESVAAQVAQDNPKGFWERLDVVWANDRLLQAAGGSWWRVDELDFGAASAEALAPTHAYLANILLRLDANRPWFIKDPRLCLTLEHWLPRLECPVFIHAQRSPVQVALSLLRRNALPLAYGVGLWEFYTRNMLRTLGDRPRIPVRYEELLRDPWQTVVYLHGALMAAGVHGLRLPQRAEVEAFVDPGLQHGDNDALLPLEPPQRELAAALEQGRAVPSAPDREEALRRDLRSRRSGQPWADVLKRERVEELPPEQMESGLRERNAMLQVRVHALEASLQRLRDSRLLRGVATLTGWLGRADKGLAAELARVERLLRQAPLPGSGPVAPSAISRLVTALSGVLRILHPRRVKNGLLLLTSGRSGLRQVLLRCRRHLSGVRSSLVPTLPLEDLPLVGRYGLPRSSGDARPSPATDAEIASWRQELYLLMGTLAQAGPRPTVSIIIPVHNQIRFTLACLHSIYLNTAYQDYEIIVADDASSDQTLAVFSEEFSRVHYLRNETNLGFLRTCNKAALAARGAVLVFLNNDTVVLPNWLTELVRTFDEHPGAGMVGARLIYPEGALQEAGGIVFEDGGAWNYGRMEDPRDPRFCFARDADYCSGACIAVDAALWHRLGGFDERFAPAYYEDTDLAFQVRAAGKRVLFQPCSRVVHFEGVSNGTSEASGVKRHQAVNKLKFRTKWARELAGYGLCDPGALPALRAKAGRVLVVDATTPTPDKDSGSIDARNLMCIFLGMGFHVVFLPESCCHEGHYTEELQRIGIECLYGPWVPSVQEGIRRYAPGADLVVLTRVGVAAPLVPLVRECAPQAKICFDTVDLHFLRESREAELDGSAVLAGMARKTRELELEVIARADLTLLRSAHEVDVLREALPGARLLQMPIMRDVPGPAPTPWGQRKDIVFIGGYAHPPNVDAVKHFVAEVMPLLRERGFPGRFVIAGSDPPSEVLALAAGDVEVRGFVEDLGALFGGCRLTVAPLRYGAGMKGKVISSLTHGVPCVASPIAVEGSVLTHGEHLLVAETGEEMAQAIMTLYADEALWQRLSQAGVQVCREVYSFETVARTVTEAMEDLLAQTR